MILNAFIFEISHEKCDGTQFNQLDLNSSFSIWLLINWLICQFMSKQLLRVGYCIIVIEVIKIMEDKVRLHEKFRCIFCRKFFVCNNGTGWIFLCELSSLNPFPGNFPFQRPSDEFQNHLRNIKYFLLKGNLDSRLNLCNTQHSNFCNNTPRWYAWRLVQAVRNSFLNDISHIFIGRLQP